MAGKQLRSRSWFDNPHNPGMTAMYIERYMNFGITREELQSGKPIVGIAQTGSDLSPCNRIHQTLAERMRAGIREAGGIAIEFPVHPIQESGRRPTAAIDRNLAYLGLVEVLHGYPIDGVILTTGCDKTTPAMIMAAATANLPAISLNGGPMFNGWWKGRRVGSGTIVWEARKLQAAGEIGYEEFIEMVASSAPSPGHCNTMGTATTMNSLAEALGMSLPGSAAPPAPHKERAQYAYETGRRIVAMIHEDLTPDRILTRAAFENAIAVNSAIGGSTNAPIHINAIARHMGVELRLEDWQDCGYDIPLLVNCQPAGGYLAEDYHRAGGVPAVMGELLRAGKLNADALTVTGRTTAENIGAAAPLDEDVIRPWSRPLKERAGFVVMGGNLFDAAVMKTSVISEEFRRPFPLEPRRPRRLRRQGHRVRRAGGLPRAPRRPGARHRRDQHTGDARRGAGRLSGLGRGGQHAAARIPHPRGRDRAADHRRRPPVRHFGQPLDPEREPGKRCRRQSRHTGDGRPAARGPAEAPRRYPAAGGGAGRAARRLRPAGAGEPHAMGGALPQPCGPARGRWLPGVRHALPPRRRLPAPPLALSGGPARLFRR